MATTKYLNKKVYIDGMIFDSKKEYKRWLELKLLEDNGKISSLTRQTKYLLIPSQRDSKGKVIERAIEYIADFSYWDNEADELVVEDVKGYRDTSSAGYSKFVIKRKLMLYQHGIRIKEV